MLESHKPRKSLSMLIFGNFGKGISTGAAFSRVSPPSGNRKLNVERETADSMWSTILVAGTFLDCAHVEQAQLATSFIFSISVLGR